jgi:hypothetical protein
VKKQRRTLKLLKKKFHTDRNLTSQQGEWLCLPSKNVAFLLVT